jgi:hypothetical protein
METGDGVASALERGAAQKRADGLVGTIAGAVLAVVVATVCAVDATLLVRPQRIVELAREDGPIEYAGFAGLLLTGIVLAWAAVRRRGAARALCAGVGLLFVVAAGEEVSWGQRVLDLPTPEFLIQLNDQDELNLHNVSKKLFDRALRYAITVFAIAGTGLWLAGVTRLSGIALPSASIVLAFAVLPAVSQYRNVSLEYHVAHLAVPAILLVAARRGDRALVAAAAVALAAIVATIAVHAGATEALGRNSAHEVRESLFAVACLGYALAIAADPRAADRAAGGAPGAGATGRSDLEVNSGRRG